MQSQIQDGPAADCKIEGRFIEAAHTTDLVEYRGRKYSENHVHWVIEIESRKPSSEGSCPAGRTFELAIRGADFVFGKGEPGRYVYPVHITPPRPEDRLALFVRKQEVRDPRTSRQYSEWLVTNWSDGYQTIQR
ncbi:MAG: hypothetical protein AB1540_03565 [Bdellovibrionota bacterium]